MKQVYLTLASQIVYNINLYIHVIQGKKNKLYHIHKYDASSSCLRL